MRFDSIPFCRRSLPFVLVCLFIYIRFHFTEMCILSVSNGNSCVYFYSWFNYGVTANSSHERFALEIFVCVCLCIQSNVCRRKFQTTLANISKAKAVDNTAIYCNHMDKRFLPFGTFSLHTLCVCDGNILVFGVLKAIRNYILVVCLRMILSPSKDKSRKQICPIFSTFRKFRQQQFIKCSFSAHPPVLFKIGLDVNANCWPLIKKFYSYESVDSAAFALLLSLSPSPVPTLTILRRLTFLSNPESLAQQTCCSLSLSLLFQFRCSI